MEEKRAFRSGFVNIVGLPNAGKSTLMNALVGERMSAITHKPQTTRHRILGILTGDDYQIVFSDTPGYVSNPTYQMHKSMNRFVEGTLEDADLMLLVIDATEDLQEDNPLLDMLKKNQAPLLVVVNKMDQVQPQRADDVANWWRKRVTVAGHIGISASNKENIDQLLEHIRSHLPEGPAYFPPDQLTDRSERFFIAEIIREKIFLQFSDEVPYSCEVGIESFQETNTNAGEPLARIHAVVYVMRESQKPILLGKNGAAMKKLATASRQAMETFLQSKVFLEITVKVRENWRDNERYLEQFGYR